MKTIYIKLRKLQDYKGVVMGNGHVVDFTPIDIYTPKIEGEKKLSDKYGMEINGKWVPLSKLPTDINELNKIATSPASER